MSGPVGGNKERWDRCLGDDLPLALCSRKSTGYVEFQLTLDEFKEHQGVFYNRSAPVKGFPFNRDFRETGDSYTAQFLSLPEGLNALTSSSFCFGRRSLLIAP